MKISIWQQFSSNHSSHFMLVGLFQTPMAAQVASERIQAVLTQIAKWHEANPEISEQIHKNYVEEEDLISPPEKIFAKAYQIKWDLPILWFDNYKMTIYEQLIFIESKRQAETGAHPMDELINRLDGQAFIQGDLLGWDERNELRFELKCSAPDSETAVKIATEFHGKQVDTYVFDIFLTTEGPLYADSPQDIIRVLDTLKNYGCWSIQLISTQIRQHYLRFGPELDD